MNYNQMCVVKDTLDTFNDCSFVSIIGESEVAVKNDLTGEIWKIEFSFDENDQLSFNTENAVVIEGSPEEESKIDAKQEIIQAFAHSLINEDDTGIQYVKEAILEAEDLFRKGQTVVTESQESDDSNEVFVFREDLQYDEDERNAIVEIANKWEEQVEQFNQSKKEFHSVGNLFEDGVIKSEVVNPFVVLEAFEQKKQAIATLMSSKDQLSAFHESMKSIFEDESQASEALKGINALSISDKDLETRLTKNLVVLKKDYNEDLNIRETTKKVIETRREIFGEALGESNLISPQTGVWQNNKKLNYLRFQSGFFTRKDLNTIMEDFDNILGNFLNMNRDDYLMIQEMKDTIDYMYRTNQIVDEVVVEVINKFNESFFSRGIPDSKQDYFNPEKSGPDTTGQHLKAYHRSIAPGSV